MRVTLAYPFQGHKPDETIDVDKRTARTLLRDGRARVAPPEIPRPKRTYTPRSAPQETPAETGPEQEAE